MPAYDIEVSNRVKDGIRDLAITDIIFLLNQTLLNYQIFDTDTVNDALEGIARLIDWNALELFAPLVDIFKNFLLLYDFRTKAIECLHAMVHKGMDYPQKIELIVNL